MPEDRGGLNMINLPNFWKALKITWLRRLLATKSTWADILDLELGKLGYSREDLYSCGNSHLRKISTQLRNPFWKDVLNNSAEMIDNIPFSHPKSLTLLPVCGSTIFKIAKSTIKYNIISGKRDILVIDLIHDDKRFLNLAEFNKKITQRSTS